MIQRDLPRPEAVDVDLKPEVFLGGTPAVGGNRASFGGPDITALTAASLQNDPDLLTFVTSSGFDYYLLAMTLSLAAAPGSRIHNSTVAISLTSEPDAAIAWSMNPLRLDGPPVTTKTGGSIEVGLGPMLKSVQNVPSKQLPQTLTSTRSANSNPIPNGDSTAPRPPN